jgi:hypothetical protein
VSNAQPSPRPPTESVRRRELPPLILHPFTDDQGPETLVDCSRAQLMLAGILPDDGISREKLEDRVLRGRVCECKMLYYVGLDLDRWLVQCTEVVARDEELNDKGLSLSSFAALLVGDCPPHVHEKLQGWGVADYKSLFARALGLNAVFSKAPDAQFSRRSFLLDYHRYADGFYHSWSESNPGSPATSESFTFDLYASGEYSRILETQWANDSDDFTELDSPPS